MKNAYIMTLIACLIVGGASFYGGMKYGASKSKNFTFDGQRPGGGMRGGFGGVGGARGGANGGAGFVNGSVLAKDDKSVIVQLRAGGSKIVFYSTSTKVGKMVDGIASDLKIGENVTVMGDANSDGSVTAQTIQIRPQDANVLPATPPATK